MREITAAKDTAKVMRAAGDMQSRFGGTAYAQMSALAAAKVASVWAARSRVQERTGIQVPGAAAAGLKRKQLYINPKLVATPSRWQLK